MAERKSLVLCEYCGWKRVCDPENPGIPALDNDTLSSKKLRCPGCGRGVTPRPAADPQSDLDRKAKDDRAKAEYDSWMEKSVEFQRSFLKGSDEQNID